MTAEDIVFFAAGAVRAFQAADEEQSHTYRDHNGKDVSVSRKPVNQAVHTEGHHTSCSKI
jgi:hypothetical protein